MFAQPQNPLQPLPWTVSPGGLDYEAGASALSYSPTNSTPGEYTVTASALCDNGAVSAEAVVRILKVDVEQDEISGCPKCLEGQVFSLSSDSYAGEGGFSWGVSDSGASLTPANNGFSAVFHPGTNGVEYTITASAAGGACSDTAKARVFVPGEVTQDPGDWVYDGLKCSRLVRHSFWPTPLTSEAGRHFGFVQKIKGTARRANGAFIPVKQYGSQTNTPINFTDFVIDSTDASPIYWSQDGVNVVFDAAKGGYHVEDEPCDGYSFNAGDVINLEFQTALYCAKMVPQSGADNPNIDLGEPFQVLTWDYKIHAYYHFLTGGLLFSH